MRLGIAVAIILVAALVYLRPVLPVSTDARLASAYDWDARGVGGLSGLAMLDQGATALALVDKAIVLRVDLSRTGDQIVGASVADRHVLVADRKKRGAKFDTEGIALAQDGTIYVSYEQDQRIIRYDLATGAETRLRIPTAFRSFGKNSGLESLAIDDQGRLFTLPEVPRTKQMGFPVWRWDGVQWSRPFHLSSRDGFLAVSAEIGPDGRFYLLERRLTFVGFQTRLRRWTLTEDAAIDEATLLITRPGRFANLEGLSLWRDSSGGLRATMVSDDNFWPIMRTQIVEFILTE